MVIYEASRRVAEKRKAVNSFRRLQVPGKGQER